MTTPIGGKQARHEDKGSKKASFWTLKRKAKVDEENVEHPPFVPALPRVNLVPLAVHDSVRAGKLRRWFILASVLLIVSVAGIWYLQSSQISDAEQQLASAQATNSRITAAQKALDPVKGMYTEITRLQTLVDGTLASQPLSATVIRHLQDAGTNVGGVIFDRAEVTYTGIPKSGTAVNACPNPDPFSTQITIGCLSFGATAQSRDQVAALLRALDQDPLFMGPYVTSSTVDNSGPSPLVTFAGSAGVSLEALKTQLTKEQIQTILTPPKASPEPTTEGGG
jgi:Tfp pilus assembly protein PilN